MQGAGVLASVASARAMGGGMPPAGAPSSGWVMSPERSPAARSRVSPGSTTPDASRLGGHHGLVARQDDRGHGAARAPTVDDHHVSQLRAPVREADEAMPIEA